MDRINKISIISIKMEGFKRFKEPYEIKPDPEITYISGGNGQGKTSVADAIAYVFCGTPFWGEKSSDRLQNPDCKEMQVEVQFVDENGEIHTLSRRRSDGNTTTITMDRIQLRQMDIVNIFADRDVFLSVLNPLYFIEKIASDGREFLQKLLPSVSDDEVLNGLSDSIKAILENEEFSEPEYYIQNKREELKEIKENCNYIEGQIDLLQKQQRETEEKLDSVLEKGSKIVERKTVLEEKQFDGIDIEAIKAEQARIAESLSDDKKSSLLAKEAEVRNRQYESKYSEEMAKAKAELYMLSEKYKKMMEKIKSIRVGEVCPTCRTVIGEDNYKTIVSAMKTELAEVCEQGNAAKKAYTDLVELDKKSREKFEEFKADDLKKVQTELSELDGGDVSEIAMLDDKIKYGNLTPDEYAELTELTKQADAFAKEVEVLCETDKIPDKIAALQKNAAANQAREKEIRDLIHAVGEFAAKKAEITLSKLKMDHAAIKLYDVVKTTGEIKNVFRFTYDDKDYRWLSTSEKIKAGLEVSELLRKLTGLSYPTYIDNAECITTKLLPVHGQIILAFTRNTELSVQYPNKQQNSRKEAA